MSKLSNPDFQQNKVTKSQSHVTLNDELEEIKNSDDEYEYDSDEEIII